MGDFGPRAVKNCEMIFLFSIFYSNEFYSNSNDFYPESKTKALNNAKIMHDSMNATTLV
jgi:hypothetical protein